MRPTIVLRIAASLPNNLRLYLASRDASYGHIDGVMDDIRIWDDIRTQGEIQANDDTQLNGNEANLVAYWMLNNNSEDKGEITDPAGSDSEDATLVNSPVYDTDVPFGAAPPAAIINQRRLIIE